MTCSLHRDHGRAKTPHFIDVAGLRPSPRSDDRFENMPPPFRFPTAKKSEFGERANASGPFTSPKGDLFTVCSVPLAESTEYALIVLESAFETYAKCTAEGGGVGGGPFKPPPHELRTHNSGSTDPSIVNFIVVSYPGLLSGSKLFTHQRPQVCPSLWLLRSPLWRLRRWRFWPPWTAYYH